MCASLYGWQAGWLMGCTHGLGHRVESFVLWQALCRRLCCEGRLSRVALRAYAACMGSVRLLLSTPTFGLCSACSSVQPNACHIPTTHPAIQPPRHTHTTLVRRPCTVCFASFHPLQTSQPMHPNQPSRRCSVQVNQTCACEACLVVDLHFLCCQHLPVPRQYVPCLRSLSKALKLQCGGFQALRISLNVHDRLASSAYPTPSLGSALSTQLASACSQLLHTRTHAKHMRATRCFATTTSRRYLCHFCLRHTALQCTASARTGSGPRSESSDAF